MKISIADIFIHKNDRLHEAISCINRSGQGIALVVDEQRHLIGTITDGDMRRALLEGENLDTIVETLLERKANTPYAQPVSSPIGTPGPQLLQLMQAHSIKHIPLLDEQKRVVDLITIDDLLPKNILPLQAVIMAGGKGMRLRPLTEDLPKPMLPVGDRPLMEHIIRQLEQAGIQQVNVTTHYLPEKITEYFGNGDAFGVDIHYVTENKPLGTAGALGLMEQLSDPLLVINGDILTQIDFRAMLSYHQKHKADMTVAVRRYDIEVPYGIVESDGPYIQALQEKPHFNFLVNAGIYLLEPTIKDIIPNDQPYDMTNLIESLIEKDGTVVSFPIVEYWLDIGKPEHYQQAQDDVQNGRLQF